MLTIACVYRSFVHTHFGHSYDETWVQKLAAGVARNLTVPHRFVCLTNMGEIEGVETIPLVNEWEGWWSKIELFRPGLFDGPVLSFDLDVMFTGSIDHMAGPFPTMMMLHDVVPGIKNSTCMWWDASDPAYGVIYETFARDPEGRKLYHNVMNQRSMGDQGLISEVMTALQKPITLWQDAFGAERFVHFSAFNQINPAVLDVSASANPFSYLNTMQEKRIAPAIEQHKPMVYCLGAPKFPSFPTMELVRRFWN